MWIALVTSGFAVYLLLNWLVTGDASAFLRTRKVSFEQTFALLWAGIWKMVRAHYRTPNEAEMVGVQELAFLALGFICTIISWIKLRPIYAAWMTGNLILFARVNYFRSIPRYTLTIFPSSYSSVCSVRIVFGPVFSQCGRFCSSPCSPFYLPAASGRSNGRLHRLGRPGRICRVRTVVLVPLEIFLPHDSRATYQ